MSFLSRRRSARRDEIEIGDMRFCPADRGAWCIAAQQRTDTGPKGPRGVREKVYEEYIDRKGELINGTVSDLNAAI